MINIVFLYSWIAPQKVYCTIFEDSAKKPLVHNALIDLFVLLQFQLFQESFSWDLSRICSEYTNYHPALGIQNHVVKQYRAISNQIQKT